MVDKNILVTTLDNRREVSDIKYYCVRTKSGDLKFCNGITRAESGVKSLLSSIRLDKIYALGAPGAEDDINKEILIKNTDDYPRIDSATSSEFDFFCYRISEFLNHIDIEDNDILFSDERYDTKGLRQLVKDYIPRSQYGYLYSLATDQYAVDRYNQMILEVEDEKSIRILKHLIYKSTPAHMLLQPTRQNENVTARFFPVSDVDKFVKNNRGLLQIVKQIVADTEGPTNVILDLQAFDRVYGYLMLHLFEIVCKSNPDVCIKTIISSHKEDDSFIYYVEDESEIYDINTLVRGIDVLIEYGRTDILRGFIASKQMQSDVFEKIMQSLAHIETGISLNNIPEITYGLKALKFLLDTFDPDTMDQKEHFYYMVIENGLWEEFGCMMEGESLSIPDLISWALDKGFCQQAITMIEALFPKDIVTRGIYYYAQDISQLETIKKDINVYYWNQLPRNRYQFEDIDHYFIKYYGKEFINFRQAKDKVQRDYAHLRIEQLKGIDPNMFLSYSNLSNDDMLYELLLAYYNIGLVRNNISHAISMEDEVTALNTIKEETISGQLTKTIRTFLNIYKSACKKVKESGIDVKPVLLSGTQFKEYALKHKLEPLCATDEGDIINQNIQCSFNGQDLVVSVKLLKPQDSTD